jgi:hypothetical protein
MLAHVTPLETVVVCIAFTAGLALGIAGTMVVLRRRPGRTPAR